jgi:hypothetical protein
MSVDVDDPEVLRAEARRKRRAFARSPLSPFVTAMQACMRDYLAARAHGVSQEDAVRGIEEVVRAVWPVRRSKFPPTCTICDDLGWRVVECHHGLRCGRERCSWAEDAWTHPFVVPCGCTTGDRFRRSGQRPRVTPEDDLAAAGKTRKSTRGFARLAEDR